MNKIKNVSSNKFHSYADAHGMTIRAMANTILRNREKYSPAMIKRAMLARKQANYGDGGMYVPDIPDYKKGGMHINPANKGKFTATQKRTGKSTTQLVHSKNPKTAKRANFARMAKRHWKPLEEGGLFQYADGGIAAARKKPGGSNVGKKTFANGKKRTGPYVGPSGGAPAGSYPIPDLAHAKAAIKLSGHAPNPAGIKAAVRRKYPQLKKHGIGGLLMQLPAMINQINAGIDAKHQAEEVAIENAKQGEMAGQAGIINPYPTTFKIGGMFKGKKFGGKPNAEVEGGEVLITPDGDQTNVSGPKHSQGGVDMKLPNNTMILSDKIKVGKGQTAADAARPYTSKINKAQDVISGNATKLAKQSAKLNLNKYYAKVIDTFNRQEAKKFGKGGLAKFQGGGIPGGYTIGDSWQDPNLMFKDQYKVDFGMSDFNAGKDSWYQPLKRAQFPGGVAPKIARGDYPQNLGYVAEGTSKLNMPTLAAPVSNKLIGASGANDIQQPVAKEPTDWGSILSDVGAMAPMLYNLFAGKPKDINEQRYKNYNAGKINSLMADRTYNIDPELAANENAFRTTAANMRNLGGSRGQIMSNLTGAQNTKQFGDMSAYAQKHNAENQYRGDYANMLYGIGRDETSGRIAHDEAEAMDQASYRNMKGAAMTGLQQYLLTRRQMKNQAARDKLLASAIKGYSPYANKWIPGLTG